MQILIENQITTSRQGEVIYMSSPWPAYGICSHRMTTLLKLTQTKRYSREQP